MFILSETIDLAVSPQFAFDWVVDVDNLPRWQSGVFESRVQTPPPAHVGTRFTETLKLMGFSLTSECEVVELKSPSAYGFNASGRQMNYQSRFSFVPTDTGTRVTLTATIAMRGLWKLLEPMVRGEGVKETRAELTRLKEAVEADAAARPPLKVAASR